MAAPFQFPKVDIEAVMTVAAEAAGGEHLMKRFGPSPGFDNADYYFPQDHIVAELKLLSEDLYSKVEFRERLEAMLNKWVTAGAVYSRESGLRAIATGRCPLPCQRELFAFLRSKLESSTLKKANGQIKETKKRVSDPNALGLLILANDGNAIFSPRMLLDVCSLSLRKYRRSIESMIFLAPNLQVAAPGGPIPHSPWMNFNFNQRREVPEAFSYRLHDAWCRAHCDAMPGVDVVSYRTQFSRSDFDRLGYVPARLYPPLKEGQ